MWNRLRDVSMVACLLFFCVMSYNMWGAVRASADKAISLVEEDIMVEYTWWIRINNVCIGAKATGQTAAEAEANMIESHALHAPVSDCP